MKGTTNSRYGPTSLVTYGLGFWFLEGPLLPPFGRPLLPPPRRPLPPPFGGLPLGCPLLLSLKGPSPLLLIRTPRILVGNLQAFLIGDVLPLYSWYGFSIGIVHGILGLCFLSE
jgi:hypothetical protein